MLMRSKDPASWFGVEHVFNVYRGCEHSCIYCDSRSECYDIDDFSDVQVKVNAPEMLRDELCRKRRRAVLGTGSMSDPYGPVEKEVRVTRRCLEAVAEIGFGIHISTKSDLVCRDKDLLQSIKRFSASVAFTVTTCDDGLAAKIEPGAPPPSRRLAALSELAGTGVHTGVPPPVPRD
jgi:DNA repair photolyase